MTTVNQFLFMDVVQIGYYDGIGFRTGYTDPENIYDAENGAEKFNFAHTNIRRIRHLSKRKSIDNQLEDRLISTGVESIITTRVEHARSPFGSCKMRELCQMP